MKASGRGSFRRLTEHRETAPDSPRSERKFPRLPLSPSKKSRPGVGRKKSFEKGKTNWHKLIHYAIKSNKWETVKGQLALASSYQQSGSRRGSFWQRLGGNSDEFKEEDLTGLMQTDDEFRTPLHMVLTTNKTPAEVILQMLQIEPKAAGRRNNRGRTPLHYAVANRHSIGVIGKVIDACTAAISQPDDKGLSPLSYAIDMAGRETDLRTAHPNFWMHAPDDGGPAAVWQQEQAEKWGVVHWLLLASATHPSNKLSVGGSKPMLVEALVHAASPAVINLLIGASAMLLSHTNKATAFAGSTLYTCIARHYPLTILMSLASQCPKDVHHVRDETGMGLVAAQYISRCYKQSKSSQEWTLCRDFCGALDQCIKAGEIPKEDEAFIDWWKKIEFLIAFCDGRDIASLPREQLLHAALGNTDVPPTVVKMLLALYPRAILCKDSRTDALPLHLASQKRDYIARKYETTGEETAFDMILKADLSAASKRHQRRLPLHYAISAGRPFSTFHSLVELDDGQLLQRDPKHCLYPFQQAAIYSNKRGKDSLRWTHVARNQCSAYEWTNMSDRERALKVINVKESEDVERVETIYQLLRRQPIAIENPNQRSLEQHQRRSSSWTANGEVRDSDGMGMVAAHYMSWCYVHDFEDDSWEPNAENQKMLREAKLVAFKEGSLSFMPSTFELWWSEMKFRIRQSCTWKAKKDERILSIPVDQDKFLLHAALSNSDTPPEVVEILLCLYADSLHLCIPETGLLPLHIVSQTVTYTPRPFESNKRSVLELILRAYPRAVRVMCDGRLPLHMAIEAEKTWRELEALIQEEPRALGVRDLSSGLYPYQLMAALRKISSDQRLRLQQLTRNRFDTTAWNELSPQSQTMEIIRTQKEHQLTGLSCVFELLRKDAALIKLPRAGESKEADTSHGADELSEREVGDDEMYMPNSLTAAAKRMTRGSTAGDEQSEKPITKKNSSALMQLLSQEQRASNDDLLECDASLISGVDIMSKLSGSFRGQMVLGSFHSEPVPSPSWNESSASNDESQTHFADIAEESFNTLELVSGTIKEETEFQEKREMEGETGSYPSDDDEEESLVFFKLRRRPRLFMRTTERDAAPAVSLSKKPATTVDEEVASLPETSDTERRGSVISELGDSYQSVRPEDIGKLCKSDDMLWISPSKSVKSDNESSNAPSFYSNSPEKSETSAASSSTNRSRSQEAGSRLVSDRTSKRLNADGLLQTNLLGSLDDSSEGEDDDDDDRLLSPPTTKYAATRQSVAVSADGKKVDRNALNKTLNLVESPERSPKLAETEPMVGAYSIGGRGPGVDGSILPTGGEDDPLVSIHSVTATSVSDSSEVRTVEDAKNFSTRTEDDILQRPNHSRDSLVGEFSGHDACEDSIPGMDESTVSESRDTVKDLSLSSTHSAGFLESVDDVPSPGIHSGDNYSVKTSEQTCFAPTNPNGSAAIGVVVSMAKKDHKNRSTPGHKMYFDKDSMRWKTRAEEIQARAGDGEATSPNWSATYSTGDGEEVYFDKKSMHWKIRKTANRSENGVEPRDSMEVESSRLWERHNRAMNETTYFDKKVMRWATTKTD